MNAWRNSVGPQLDLRIWWHPDTGWRVSAHAAGELAFEETRFATEIPDAIGRVAERVKR